MALMLLPPRLRTFLTVLPLLGFTAKALAGSEYKYIDAKTIIFGYEGTFQSFTMSNESGSSTFLTPHKGKKIREFVNAITKNIGQPQEIDDENMQASFKPSIQMQFENESIKLNLEPGVIEVNQTPKTIYELKKAWEPIYKAAKSISLKSSFEALGEGGGGGHFHVGGKTPAQNPFLKNPLLLRNLLVYTNQHPSLLFAFAEAYDLGRKSSIQTLHEDADQKAFRKLIEGFDKWYDNAGSQVERQAGLDVFLENAQNFVPILFAHDVFINLEHIQKILEAGDLSDNDKLSVEWRNIRPLKSAEQVEIMGQFLLKQIDYCSQPGFKVPFQFISEQQYLNFLGPAYTEYDWSLVKKDLNITGGRLKSGLDEMVYAYTRNKDLDKEHYRDGKIREAYTESEAKGPPNKEIILPVSEKQRTHVVVYKGMRLNGNQITIDNKKYVAAVVSKDSAKFPAIDLMCKDVLLIAP